MGDGSISHVEATSLPGPPPVTRWNHLKTCILVLAVSSQYFCQMLLLVGGGTQARNIAAVVGGATLTSWPTAAIAIATVALGPPVAQAADFWGRKWFLVASTVLGFVACIIVSRAHSMGMVIAGFAIGGAAFGAGPLLIAVVSEVLPRKYRSWAQATVNGVVGVGAVFALLVGGTLTRNNNAGFRTYFYIAAAVYAASGLATALLYNPPPREEQRENTRQKLRQLDWIGYFLITTGLSLFCLGLSWAQNPYPWRNAHVLGPFLTGAAIIFVLIWYETMIHKTGLFHHALFRDRNFPIACLSIFIEGFGALGVNYYLPFELSVMFPTMSTFRITLCYSVVYYTFLVFLALAGLYVQKTRSIRSPIIAGNACYLLFFILAATIKTSTPEANFWGYSVIFGAGLAMLLVSLVVAAQFSTPPELIAITSGLLISVRSLGGSISLAVLNAILSHGIAENLAPKVATAVIPLGLSQESLGPLLLALTSGNEAALAKIPGITPDIIAAAAEAVKDAYRLAFSYVWATAGAVVFVALVAAFFFKDPKDEFSARIDAPIDVDVDAKTYAMGKTTEE